jgi:UDP-N-acetylmuramyl pentapeptide phosphotransferase/UDP-N-acetylglucosamine-1-phosphate transferase
MSEEGPTSQEELVPRMGTFFIILGIFALIFFLASDFAKRPDFDWLFIGMVLIGIGIILRRRAPPPPPTGRFSMVRKMRENAKKRKEEKAKKAKKK